MDIALKRLVLLVSLAGLLGGCGSPTTCPRAIFLDGAGWYTGDGPVRAGLREAGFVGPVERFGWASLLGPVPDHILAGGLHPKIGALADRISELRKANPSGKIVLVGLSAGTSILVRALERLPDDVQVDYVVLLSPSISSRHDLGPALRHVRHRLYATSSEHDTLLAAAPTSAGLGGGRPAGRFGFELPESGPSRMEYSKVVPLPWQPSYAAYGWNGGHVSVTSREFIRVVIAPRILDERPHPLDQPMLAGSQS